MHCCHLDNLAILSKLSYIFECIFIEVNQKESYFLLFSNYLIHFCRHNQTESLYPRPLGWCKPLFVGDEMCQQLNQSIHLSYLLILQPQIDLIEQLLVVSDKIADFSQYQVDKLEIVKLHGFQLVYKCIYSSFVKLDKLLSEMLLPVFGKRQQKVYHLIVAVVLSHLLLKYTQYSEYILIVQSVVMSFFIFIDILEQIRGCDCHMMQIIQFSSINFLEGPSKESTLNNELNDFRSTIADEVFGHIDRKLSGRRVWKFKHFRYCFDHQVLISSYFIVEVGMTLFAGNDIYYFEELIQIEGVGADFKLLFKLLYDEIAYLFFILKHSAIEIQLYFLLLLLFLLLFLVFLLQFLHFWIGFQIFLILLLILLLVLVVILFVVLLHFFFFKLF